ncbi:MAG: AAA family ATPase [Alphaproteobacteria bacterium]|nr:AAA family ATPase [Alphaproteobacteria bacterium]
MRIENPHRVIVIGNEKGGTGKSTTAMHMVMSLLYDGYRIGLIDLDRRQGSLIRYLESRRKLVSTLPAEMKLLFPEEVVLESDDLGEFDQAMFKLLESNDIVLLDCPGNDTPLSRRAHFLADMLLTPLNESFVDFAVLAQVDPSTLEVGSPSHYSQMVWEQKTARLKNGLSAIDWVVIRNRITETQDGEDNRENFKLALEGLRRKLNFRVVKGFSERAIFRELYPQGITLLDYTVFGIDEIKQVAARQELRELMQGLAIKRQPEKQRKLTDPAGYSKQATA